MADGDLPRRRGPAGGRPAVLPDVDELLRLKRELGVNGKPAPNGKIGAMFGVSGEAVRRALERAKTPKVDTTWQRHWPSAWWSTSSSRKVNGVATDHRPNYIYRQLLNYTQRRQGVKLNEQDARMVDEFLAHLRKNNLTVYYDYDSPAGFRLRSRRPEDDPEVIWVDGP